MERVWNTALQNVQHFCKERQTARPFLGEAANNGGGLCLVLACDHGAPQHRYRQRHG